MKITMKWSRLLVCVLMLPILSAFADDCKIGGQDVNLNNGNSTAGKTGMVICKNSSGTVVRELEYVQGKHIGREMVITGMGEKVEKVVNEKGNSNGLERHYDRNGTLVSERNFVNGREQGLQRGFNMKGKLISLSWAEAGRNKFSVHYDDAGKPSDLQCGDKSYTPEDRDLCGFGGKKSTVMLSQYKDKAVVYQNGKMLEASTYDDKGKLERNEKIDGNTKKVTELFPDGKVKIEAEYIGHQLNGEEKEYHSSGKIIRKTQWNAGHMESEWKYYLNGSAKEHSARKQIDKKWFLMRELFWDNGKQQDIATFEEKTASYSWEGFALDRWTYESPVGEHRRFFEDGQLSLVEHYDPKGNQEGLNQSYGPNGRLILEENYIGGKVKTRKTWDASGKLLLDEEYLEDGSRVNHAKGDKV
jgi:antitoxin component YwqK of YwqJK toxin-antitoxin module